MSRRKVKSSTGLVHEYGAVNPDNPGSHIKLPKTADEYKYDSDFAGGAQAGKGSLRRRGENNRLFRKNAVFLPESPNLRERK